MASAALKLAEEADIVLGEETKILHTVFEIGDTLHAHTEGIAGIDFAVNAACLEHVGIHHAATENLYPTGTLAERAAFAAAYITTDIHLGARLGEREIRRTETNLRFCAEHLL